MTIAVKMTKDIGRHYGKRLYKAGIIYHVDQAEAEYLLAYKDLDGIHRFKRMIPKEKTVALTPKAETPKKRKRGRPKKSPKIDDVVDEKPVEVAPESVEDIKYEDEVKEEVLQTETFNPQNEDQVYPHEV